MNVAIRMDMVRQRFATNRYHDGMIMTGNRMSMMPAAPENAVNQHWDECNQTDNFAAHF